MIRTFAAAALLAASALAGTAAADAATFDFSFDAPTSYVDDNGNIHYGDVYIGSGTITAEDDGMGNFGIDDVSGSASIKGYPQYSYGLVGGKGSLISDGKGGYTTAGIAFFGDGGPGYYGFRPNGDGTYEIQIGEVGTPAGSLSLTLSQTAPVPEPATWAMMIGGIGLTGGALRRRRAATLALA